MLMEGQAVHRPSEFFLGKCYLTSRLVTNAADDSTTQLQGRGGDRLKLHNSWLKNLHFAGWICFLTIPFDIKVLYHDPTLYCTPRGPRDLYTPPCKRQHIKKERFQHQHLICILLINKSKALLSTHSLSATRPTKPLTIGYCVV